MHKSTAVLLLIILALAAVSIGFYRAFIEERTRADALQAQIDGEELPVAVAAPELSAGPESPVDEAGAAIDAQPEPAQKNPEIFPEKRRHLRNEAYRDARRRVRTLELTRGFIDLARVLGISQQTADRLLALLVDKEMEYLERPQFNPRNEKEVALRQLEIQQAQQERNAEIAAVIGAGNLPKWEQYEASLTWSGGMERQSHIYRNERHAELARAANDRIHVESASFLSNRQLAALDDRLRRESEMQEAEFQEKRALLEAGEVRDDAANPGARRSRQP